MNVRSYLHFKGVQSVSIFTHRQFILIITRICIWCIYIYQEKYAPHNSVSIIFTNSYVAGTNLTTLDAESGICKRLGEFILSSLWICRKKTQAAGQARLDPFEQGRQSSVLHGVQQGIFVWNRRASSPRLHRTFHSARMENKWKKTLFYGSQAHDRQGTLWCHVVLSTA